MNNWVLVGVVGTILLLPALPQAASDATPPWNTTFGGPALDRGWSICTVDDGILLAGWTASYGEGKADGWLLMLDRQGHERWNRTYGGPGDDGGFSLSRRMTAAPSPASLPHMAQAAGVAGFSRQIEKVTHAGSTAPPVQVTTSLTR